MTKPVPSFNPYRGDGRLKVGIRKAFLMNQRISKDQDAIYLADGSRFTLILSPEIAEALTIAPAVESLVSFQVWFNGTALAIAKLYKEQA